MRGLSADGAATAAAVEPPPQHRRARELRRVVSSDGTPVSFDEFGAGPPLVLVHGAFSDHDSNWELVRERFARRFRVHAVARRGRGATPATIGHTLEDEVRDVAGVADAIGEPVFLLGHSYGAPVALAAAAMHPERVRKLVLYEPARPSLLDAATMGPLEALAGAGDWDAFTVAFFRDGLRVPPAELDAVRGSEPWPPIVADSPATLHDLRALARHAFRPERFAALRVPTLLQVGTESARELYVTDALAAVLPDVRIAALERQAHEAMTTAPELYAASVERFLLA